MLGSQECSASCAILGRSARIMVGTCGCRLAGPQHQTVGCGCGARCPTGLHDAAGLKAAEEGEMQLRWCQQRLQHADGSFSATCDSSECHLVHSAAHNCGSDRKDSRLPRHIPTSEARPLSMFRRMCAAQGKARDVKWCEGRDEIAALGTDGTVSLWDVNLQRKSQVWDPLHLREGCIFQIPFGSALCWHGVCAILCAELSSSSAMLSKHTAAGAGAADCAQLSWPRQGQANCDASPGT